MSVKWYHIYHIYLEYCSAQLHLLNQLLGQNCGAHPSPNRQVERIINHVTDIE